MDESDVRRALSEHPCYNEEAHHKFARMHLPVAPYCNIQCNYCNRKFDCCNESRPGVTSEVLTPLESVEKVRYVKERIPELKVIGIAGPGDPLANKATFETLEMLNREFPDLTLCISTNGLALPGSAKKLHDLGIRFVTVTMNACDPDVGSEVYDSIIVDGKKLTGVEASSILIDRQLEGIRQCTELGMVVKVNIVMIPGVNDHHIPELVKNVKNLGVYIVNILPLIPVEGTKFSNNRAPTPLERKALMDQCEIDVKMMRHCRQCRADAIGRLGEDRSQEFVHFSGCGSGCGPSKVELPSSTVRDQSLFAVATSDGTSVDSGFGNSRSFHIYRRIDDTFTRMEIRDITDDESVSGENHRKHIENVVKSIGDCGTVVVKEIGHLPSKVLSNLGINVLVTEGDIMTVLSSSL